MREKLNLRFSAYVVVSGLVLSLGWYLVHAAQVTRTADALLQVATRAEPRFLSLRQDIHHALDPH